jgi:PAS domain S-box-containing protein
MAPKPTPFCKDFAKLAESMAIDMIFLSDCSGSRRRWCVRRITGGLNSLAYPYMNCEDSNSTIPNAWPVRETILSEGGTEQVVKRYRTNTDVEDRLLLDTIPGPAWTVTATGEVEMVNQQMLDYFGRTLEELKDWTRFIHPDDRERVIVYWKRTIQSGQPFEIESRLRRADGVYRWFQARGRPVRDPEEGCALRWYSLLTDIDEWKKAEEKLQREQDELLRKQELLDLAQRAARAMAFDWYIQEDFNTWSPEQEALYGLAPGTFDGKFESWKKLVHPDDWPIIVKAVKRSHETGDISAEFRVVWPDGSVHWLAANGQMFMDSVGQPYRMVGFTGDITPRKLAEEALRRSEAYLTGAQGLSLTGSFGWSVPDGEMFWSEETFRITACDPTTKPTLELVLQRTHPEDRSRVQDAVNRAFQEVTDLDFEHRLLLPDGSIKHVRVVGRPLRHPSGKVELVGAVMDVTAARLAFQEIQKLKDRLHDENVVLREQIDQVFMFEEIVGSSPALKTVLSSIVKVAPTDSTVLITGETGTGKELIARAIHKGSHRAGQPFIAVNCAAVPSALIASELFGHEKGAFTGALQHRQGRFELAHCGTIFLDEIGELPAETQIALLRVLQERQFERVGGSRVIPTDVRVITATNRDLAAATATGAFRADLFYRLNVFPIHVPPLRNRKEDIPILVEYFVTRYADKARKRISKIDKNTLKLCQSYHWPGNIRELQNIVERSVILCAGDTFRIDPAWLSCHDPARQKASGPLTKSIRSYEKELIEAALAESNGKVAGPNGAAAKLGIPRSTLDLKIKQLNIKKNTIR